MVAVGAKDCLRPAILKECKAAKKVLEDQHGEEGAKKELESIVGKIRDLARAVVEKKMLEVIDQLVDLAAFFVDNSDLYGSLLFNSGYHIGFPPNLDEFVSYCSEGGEVCASLMRTKVMGCMGFSMHGLHGLNSLTAPASVGMHAIPLHHLHLLACIPFPYITCIC
jgi:hypothetical protein